MNTLGQKDQLLVKLLSASTLRHTTLTNNLVNQNTPGYRRQTVAFEELLAKELEELRPLLSSVTSEIRDDEITPSRMDGNNVNMELELNGMLQNRMRYEMYSTILAGRMEALRTAIEDGR